MILKNKFSYYVGGWLLCIQNQYQGWAVNKGRFVLIRDNDMVKLIVAKKKDKSIDKYFHLKPVELLLSCTVKQPYEAKSKLNQLLKPYKISKHNTYEYKIDNSTLLNILLNSKIKFGYPMCGDFAEKIFENNKTEV